MFSLIVAHDQSLAIGYQGWMPWNLKEDLRLFKERTWGHKIVMGSTTFNGLKKPLPNRHTIVITHHITDKINTEDVTYCDDFKKYLLENKDTEEEIFICGGASVYAQALPYCKKLYISYVDGQHTADTFFPEYSTNDYEIVKKIEYEGFTFIEYIKKD